MYEAPSMRAMGSFFFFFPFSFDPLLTSSQRKRKKKLFHSATTSTTSALWSLAEKSSLAVVAERALRPP